MDLVTLGLAQKYTKDTANELGAVKGAPATISSIEKTDNGNNVTFQWEGKDGTIKTQSMFVKDGAQGPVGPQGPKGEPGGALDLADYVKSINGIYHPDENGNVGIPTGGGSAEGAVLYTEQKLTEEEKAQARDNIGALGNVAPRAQVRQIYCRDTDGKIVQFADIYFAADWSYGTYEGQYRYTVFGLEAHDTTSTKQRVFKSGDGGETWQEYCSLPMDAANGQWYTDFAVDDALKAVYLLRVNDGVGNDYSVASFYLWAGDGKWYKRETDIELGAKRWLSNNSFEICRYGATSVAMFGEYGTTTDGTAYCLWRTTNGGATWKKALEIVGDNDTSGTMMRGDIRHWHTVKADPYTKHIWASAGDTDAQCKIYRSKDGGTNWELMFSGSQRERTCGFIFEEDCIYYGMDAKHGTDPNFTRIVKIDKYKLDDDRKNCREDVAVVDSCRPVYGLTRTFYPDGFIVWTQQEPDSVFKTNDYKLQFYDYATKKLYTIAYFDISNMPTTRYIGFQAGAKCQSLTSGVIFAKPTNELHQEKYGFSHVSKHIKINLTM